MFGFGPATRIYLAAGATDMRKGFEGLYGLVRDRLQGDPLSGHLFLFCNAQRNRLKILVWDGSGLWVCAKRLEKGKFRWPEASGEQGKVQLSHEELALLLGGIDLRQAGFTPDPNLLLHAQSLGYPGPDGAVDFRWQQDWNSLTPPQDTQAQLDLGNWCNLVNPNVNYVRLPPMYQLRWGQVRPSGSFPLEDTATTSDMPPCGFPSGLPQRGPWQGFFADNLNKTTVINAYNQNDRVLSVAWMLMQTQEKPNNDLKLVAVARAATTLGVNGTELLAEISNGELISCCFVFNPAFQANDSRSNPFWAQLPFTTAAESNVLNSQPSSNIIRQWAELSQWFPALTPPIGSIAASGSTGGAIEDLKFDSYGKPQNLLKSINTHSYLYENAFSSVWEAFSTLRTKLN